MKTRMLIMVQCQLTLSQENNYGLFFIKKDICHFKYYIMRFIIILVQSLR